MNKTVILDDSNQKQEKSLVKRLKDKANELCPQWAEMQYNYQLGCDTDKLHMARLLREAAAEIESWFNQKPEIIGILSSGNTTPISEDHFIAEFRGKAQLGFVVDRKEASGAILGREYYLIPVNNEVA
jgi:hypothetical protein